MAAEEQGSGLAGALISTLKDVLGSGAVGRTSGSVNNVAQVVLFFSGIFDGKDADGNKTHDTAKTVNNLANFAKVASALSQFASGQQKGTETIGQLAEAMVAYANFKDDVDNKGDSVMWAAAKTFVLSKVAGYIAKNVAEGVYNHSTTVREAVDKMSGGRGVQQGGGDTPTPPAQTPPVQKAADGGIQV